MNTQYIVVVYTANDHKELAMALCVGLSDLFNITEAILLHRDDLVRGIQENTYRYLECLHIFVDLHHFTSKDVNIRIDDYIKSYIGYNFVIIRLKINTKNKDEVSRLYQNACEVWDYTYCNIEGFQSLMNIKPKLVPFGYSQYYDSRSRYPLKKDIDVLFIGAPKKRRTKIIDNLRKNGLAVKLYNKVYEEEKNKLIHRSKIILNIYKNNKCINSFSISRFCHCLSNGAFIISEISQDQKMTDLYRDYIIFCNLSEISNKCRYYLEHPTERLEFAEQAYQRYKVEHRYSDNIPKETITNKLNLSQ